MLDKSYDELIAVNTRNSLEDDEITKIIGKTNDVYAQLELVREKVVLETKMSLENTEYSSLYNGRLNVYQAEEILTKIFKITPHSNGNYRIISPDGKNEIAQPLLQIAYILMPTITNDEFTMLKALIELFEGIPDEPAYYDDDTSPDNDTDYYDDDYYDGIDDENDNEVGEEDDEGEKVEENNSYDENRENDYENEENEEESASYEDNCKD